MAYFTCPRMGRGSLNSRRNSFGEWRNHVSKKIEDGQTGDVIGIENVLNFRLFNQSQSTWRCNEYISTNGQFLFCKVRPSQPTRQRHGQDGENGPDTDDGRGLHVEVQDVAQPEVNCQNEIPIVSNPQGQRQGQDHNGSPDASNAFVNQEGQNEFGGDNVDGGGLHVEGPDAAQPEDKGQNEVDDQSPYLDKGLDVRMMTCYVRFK